MFDRETAIYKRLQEHGVKISFITYGDRTDLYYADRLPGIRILCNRWGLPKQIYRRLLPILYAPALVRANVYKTNQMNGAIVAARAARLWHKPLITRCGYMWSEFIAREDGDSPWIHKIRKIEEKIFSRSRHIIVTTSMMKDDLVKRVLAAGQRTVVIPNYVLTDYFKPQEKQKDFDLVFVGRLSRQKNISSLLEAVSCMQCTLLLIGTEEKGQSFRDQIKKSKSVLWVEKVPHAKLPEEINRAKIFILPSLYEGHPKTLIEAMSCGMAVIGADSPGIRGIIRHGENGWLCGTDPDSIQRAVEKLLAEPELRERLGHNARKFAVDNFSLDRIVAKELDVIRKCVRN